MQKHYGFIKMPGITAVIRQRLFSGFRKTEDGEVYKGAV